ncbi:GNAT family N-acetyltransferase [Niabella drilacis]|uniref:Putative acetyltransferase n=1 Tax=Niabella drilacis (strain DSM 25811 / CCM 8410 / CCUG 62505 / LMG 26954 / E90) TaxID=1285928 RepID=A0A1G6Z1G8_NIADE|nr:GNAT family N-acetyltransferase [Niabella drilacis]SDD96372.1 putative acetyltransferase [Niabella drilacis]
MSTLFIRPVQEQDDARLATIIRAAFLEFNAPTRNTVFEDPTTDRLSELFRAGNAVLWVAEQEDNILGCCGIYPTEGLPEHCAELVKFYLSASARGKGVGKALFSKCLESAIALNYKEIYLESLPQFVTAVGMYEKLGFQQLGHPLGNSGHTGCTIWMLKAL